MDLTTLLGAADVLGTMVLVVVILKQQENLVALLSPFIKEIVISVLESNDRRWAENSEVIKTLIKKEIHEQRQSGYDDIYG